MQCMKVDVYVVEHRWDWPQRPAIHLYIILLVSKVKTWTLNKNNNPALILTLGVNNRFFCMDFKIFNQKTHHIFCAKKTVKNLETLEALQVCHFLV